MNRGPHWIALKRAVWQRCGGRCEDCGAPMERGSAHLHHLTYERKGAELESDVKYLCLGCHGRRHPGHNFISVAMQRAIAESRKSAPKRHNRSPRHQSVSDKDPAYERVREMMAARKAQRTASGRFGR